MSDHPREADPNVEDVAPGVIDDEEYTVREGILGYVIGLVLATLLTVVSFYVAKSDQFWQPSIPIALVVLAIAQMAVHLIFFIHITTAPDNTNNILALAFGVLIVTLVDRRLALDHVQPEPQPDADGSDDAYAAIAARQLDRGALTRCWKWRCGSKTMPSLGIAEPLRS